MGIFYREKAFHAGKKMRKNDVASSEKYACYAPACRKLQNYLSKADKGFTILFEIYALGRTTPKSKFCIT